MNVLADLGTIAPVWVIVIAAAVVLMLTVAAGYGRPAERAASTDPEANHAHLLIVGLVGIGGAAWLLVRQQGLSAPAFSGAIVVDGLGILFGLTALLGAFLALLLASAYLHEHRLSAGEFFALVLLSTAGMLVMVLAGDMMTLFIGLETMSLAVYVLAGYRKASKRSQEAALKYFIYGAFASGFLLFGIALLYGEVGKSTGTPSLHFASIAQAFGQRDALGPLAWISVGLIVGGFAFKIAAVPFHMWAPDVYEGAPTPSTGFMAVGVKAAAFAGLCRFVGATLVVAKPTETMVQVFEVLAILTMVLGNLVAVRQTAIKRMLAYSSIAHAGYALLAVVAWLSNPQGLGLQSLAYYLLAYTAMTLGGFGVVLAFERRNDRRGELSIESLAGLGQKYPALGLAMIVFMLSLAGVPPTAGFFGKLGLFYAAIEADRVGVVLVAIAASAVGAYYYLRVLVVMYMRQSVDASASSSERVASPGLAVGLWGCAAITLVVGLLPDIYLSFAKRLLSGWLG